MLMMVSRLVAKIWIFLDTSLNLDLNKLRVFVNVQMLHVSLRLTKTLANHKSTAGREVMKYLACLDAVVVFLVKSGDRNCLMWRAG